MTVQFVVILIVFMVIDVFLGMLSLMIAGDAKITYKGIFII